MKRPTLPKIGEKKPMPDVDLGSFHKPKTEPGGITGKKPDYRLPDASRKAESVTVQPQAAKVVSTPMAKPDSPKTKQLGLDDVYAVLDDKYAAFPNFKAANAITRASSEEVEIRLPDRRSVIVNRKKIRECFHVEQLRSYIESMIG